MKAIPRRSKLWRVLAFYRGGPIAVTVTDSEEVARKIAADYELYEGADTVRVEAIDQDSRSEVDHESTAGEILAG